MAMTPDERRAAAYESNRKYRAANLDRVRAADRERKRERREADPEAVRESVRKYREANPARSLLRHAFRRAWRKGMPFLLTEANIAIPSHCPVLGIPLEVGGSRQNQDNSPSLDRFDNTKGYTPDNVQVISYRANTLKNNATPEELMKVALYAKGCAG